MPNTVTATLGNGVTVTITSDNVKYERIGGDANPFTVLRHMITLIKEEGYGVKAVNTDISVNHSTKMITLCPKGTAG